MNILYLEIWEKPRIFRLTYQSHGSSAHCTRELFKPSKDSASLPACNEKKFFVMGFAFWERHLSKVGHFWLLAQPLDGSISLKFSLETRLESALFETGHSMSNHPKKRNF